MHRSFAPLNLNPSSVEQSCNDGIATNSGSRSTAGGFCAQVPFGHPEWALENAHSSTRNYVRPADSRNSCQSWCEGTVSFRMRHRQSEVFQ
jgi:hypothetical protein